VKVGELTAELGIDAKKFDRQLADAKADFIRTAQKIESHTIQPDVDTRTSQRQFDGIKSTYDRTRRDIESDAIEPKVSSTGIDSGMGGLASSLTGGLVGAAAAAGLAAGVVFMDKAGESMERSSSRAKTAAQLGLTPEMAKNQGRISGEIYAQAYGDSTADVDEATRAVMQNMGGLGDMSEGQFKDMVKQAMSLSTALGEDLNSVTATAGQLMKNGLARNGTEALDLIASGMQHGLNRSGDMLDTLSQYAVQWRELGLTGPQVLGMLTRGMRAGAYSTDYLGDSFNVFSELVGGGEVNEALSSMGLNAQQLSKDIASGGPAAQTATSTIMTALSNVKDPVEQNRLGLLLFGEAWNEVGGNAVLAMNPAIGALDGIKGKAAEVDTTISNSSAGWFESTKRQFFQPFNDWMDEHFTPENLSTAMKIAGEKAGETWNWVKNEVLDPVAGVAQTIWDKFTGIGDWVRDHIGDFDDFKRAIDNMGDGIKRMLDPIVGTVQTMWDSFQRMVRDGVNFYNNTIPAIAKSALGLPDQIPMPPGFDAGGVVPGALGSEQLIRAHGGETILPTHRLPLPQALSSVTHDQSRSFTVNGGVNVVSSGDTQRDMMTVSRELRKRGFLAGMS
jgi:hypothetical protein